MPKCNKCSPQPEMVLIKSGKIIGLDESPRGGLSPSYSHRHPLTAAFATALKGLAWIDNKVDLDTYECPYCKARKKKIDHSKLF